MKKTLIKNKKGTMALSQMVILLIGIFAFAWMIGGIPSVSASDPTGKEKCELQGGTCSEPLSSKAGDSCNNGKGTVVAGLCSGPVNDKRCCVPKKSDDKNSGMEVVEEVTKELAKGAIGSEVPVNNEELTKKIKDDKNFTGFLGGFNGTWGIIVNSLGAIVSAYAGYELFGVLSREIDANGPWSSVLGGIGGAAGAFSYLTWIAGVTGPWGWIAAGVVFVVAFLFTETIEEQGVAIFYCNPWDTQTGGKYCELCNKQEVPCSEYQCKSLGQACEFEPSSEEREGEPLCFWKNRNDVNPPIIRPNSDVLSIGFDYENSASISPPDRGTKIINLEDKDGCLSPFSQITFGVKLDEPAKCKMSFDKKGSYDEMSMFFGKSGRDYNHTLTLLIPELNSSIGKDNQISAYIRCQDANGNSNPANYVFQMCVQEGPDLTAPIITGTSVLNDSPISFNVTTAPVEFYVNEPAQCKWSFESGRTYEEMENSMNCVNDSRKINLRLSYTCLANLTGIKSDVRTFYNVKCQDFSERKNTNVQDYVYALSGSRALVITEATPNNTIIKDSTSPAKITLTAKTIGGGYDGKALCYYSTSGIEGTYKIFDNTVSNEHSTNVYLNSGTHNYSIRCHDLGGNADTVKIGFGIEIDNLEPLIARAYYEEGSMKIITNEKAECQFSTDSCQYSFGDGVNIPSTDNINHKIGWKTESNLYIKCQDVYGNQPASPNECSIVVRAYNQDPTSP